MHELVQFPTAHLLSFQSGAYTSPMKMPFKRKPASAFLLLSSLALHSLALPSILVAQQSAQSSPTAPTASVSADEIDHIWQQSVAKYAPERARLLADVDKTIAQGPDRAEWESIEQRGQTPDWFRDAKFGIFIHWTPFAVPAFGDEWYGRNMYQQSHAEYKHHIATYGPQAKFGFKDFIPMFRAEHFDANQWAALFAEAGARYVIPVAEHHDGFSMYDSQLSDWTVVKMGPKRDTLGELSTAIRAHGLHFGLSTHRAEHNFFFDGGRTFDSDVNDPRYASLYGPAHHWYEEPSGESTLIHDFTYVSDAFVNDWLARQAEVVEKYKPELVYFDWWAGQPRYRQALTRFAAFYKNYSIAHNIENVQFYKIGYMPPHAGTMDIERGQLSGINPLPWQTDTSISDIGWGYLAQDKFKTPEFIVHQLADIVSKNGNLLLNIGPRPDGTIPDEVQTTLRSIGGWLKQNGEAIYGTRPWNIYGEGPTSVASGSFHDVDTKPYTPQDIRYTSKPGVLYAIEMGWPENGAITIHPGKGLAIRNVQLIGSQKPVHYEYKDGELSLKTEDTAPGKYAYAWRIELTQ